MRVTPCATIASSSAAVVTTWEVSASGRRASPGCPARCTTASSALGSAKTAATASGSAQSAVCQAPVEALGLRDQVEADDLVAAVDEAGGEDPADAAGGAGDQDAHRQIRGTIRPSRSPIRRGRGLAGLEDLRVVERLAADAGGEVGDQADAEDLHAGLAGGDRLERGAHADQVAADRADHADLGGGLVVRAGELHVDALVEATGRPRGTARAAGGSRGR